MPGSLLWILNPTAGVSTQHNLKPGIDMVGGTSLTYEIKQPEGAQHDPQLAEKVATSLKQRVDPQGVRNLIWRPQGADRLEIQMPLTKQSEASAKTRQAYADARDALEATNVRIPAVEDDLATLTGAERDARIKQYAQDSVKRSRDPRQARRRERQGESRPRRQGFQSRCGRPSGDRKARQPTPGHEPARHAAGIVPRP
ncbi:MAG: hypothetical protein QM754_10930 [Tepidisphaeraceae bacterium]